MLETLPPSSAAKPPEPTVIEPALETSADVPLPLKFRRPALKSSLLMSSVEATKPPAAEILPVDEMAMPLGLTRNTWPVALSCPAIDEGVLPVTRLSAAEDVAG